jgi:hypothetical protein
MRGNLSRISASLLIVADLQESDLTEQERITDAQDALDDIRAKADTSKNWEWDLVDQQLFIGFCHGSFYIRAYTPEEKRLSCLFKQWLF